MRTPRLAALAKNLLICAFGFAPAYSQARTDHLEFQDKPRLVDCQDQPCFRIRFSAVDAQGLPAPLSVEEKSGNPSVEVIEGGIRKHDVFHVMTTDAAEATVRHRYSMLLIDTSGSMNAVVATSGMTRFETSRRAALQLLRNFREGQDHLSIVPFDSHQVVDRIRQAAFGGTTAEVRAQITNLPFPESRNNTALFTAIHEALGVLSGYKRQGHEVSLMVLTDGKNDVVPPPQDDPGLLVSSDYALVKARAEMVAVPIITIGFGASGEAIDEPTLRSLAWPSPANYYYADDFDKLALVFGAAREKFIDRWEVTFGPVRQDKSQLSGQTLSFKVLVSTPSGGKIESRNEPQWVSPAIGSPSYEERLTAAELESYIASPSRGVGASPFVSRLLWRLGIMLGFGALLAFLWFGLPRTLWPDLYIKIPAILTKAAPGRANRFGVPSAPQPPAWQGAAQGVPMREEARRAAAAPRDAARRAPVPPPFPTARPARPTDQTVFEPLDEKDREDS